MEINAWMDPPQVLAAPGAIECAAIDPNMKVIIMGNVPTWLLHQPSRSSDDGSGFPSCSGVI
ncbi:MAG: hypothetical protein ACJAYU_005209 [Bradymonadia bacterium]|jgi:hypothetical protein